MADLSSKTLKQAQPGLLHLDNGGTPIDASGTARRVDGGGGTDTALYLSTTSLGVGVSPSEELHIKGSGVTTLKIDSPAANDAELKFSDNGTDKWNIFMDDDDAHKLKFMADDNSDKIILTMDCVNARLGIGTEAPSREFDVHFAGADAGLGIVCWSDTADHNSTIVFEKSHNDTAGTDTATIDTEILGGLNFSGNNGTIFKTGAKLQVFQNGVMGTLPPSELVYTNSGTSGGALVDVWKIDKSGNMALGTRAANTTDLSGTTFDIQKSTGAVVVNWESDDNAVTLQLDAHTDADAAIKLLEAGTTKWHLYNDGNASDTLNLTANSLRCLTGFQTGHINLGPQATVSTAQVNIETTAADWGHEVLQIEQADIDQCFINFEGTSATDSTRSLSSSALTGGSKAGAIMVEINGTKRWIRFYDSAV